MSLSSIDRIEDLVNPSNIKIWVSANDVNASIGANVNTVTCKYTGTVFTKETANNFTLQTDSQGFKCLRSPSGQDLRYHNAGYSLTMTNNEIFIGIFNQYVKTYANVIGVYGGLRPGGIGLSSFPYADYTVGSGRVVWNASDNFGRKVLNVGVMSPSIMYALDGFRIKSSKANPTLASGTNINKLFINQTGTASIVDWYFVARIQEVPTQDKLKKLIRAIAFQHGVQI